MSITRTTNIQELTTSDRLLDEELIDALMAHAPDVEILIARRIPLRHQSTISADEVRQEVWRSAFRSYGSFRRAGSTAFRPWLLSLATARVIDAVRRARRLKRGAGQLVLQQFCPTAASSVMDLFSTVAAAQLTPSGEMTQSEAQEALRDAMSRLTPHQQRAISMFHLEGRSQIEIADLLGVSVAAVKSHLIRGRRRLKEMLSWERGESAVSMRRNPDEPEVRQHRYDEDAVG